MTGQGEGEIGVRLARIMGQAEGMGSLLSLPSAVCSNHTKSSLEEGRAEPSGQDRTHGPVFGGPGRMNRDAGQWSHDSCSDYRALMASSAVGSGTQLCGCPQTVGSFLVSHHPLYLSASPTQLSF